MMKPKVDANQIDLLHIVHSKLDNNAFICFIYARPELKENIKSMVNEDCAFITSVSSSWKKAIEGFEESLDLKCH